MSSDSGSSENGTTNFIEDWGPDPWGFDLDDLGSGDPPETLVERMARLGDEGHEAVLLGVFRGESA